MSNKMSKQTKMSEGPISIRLNDLDFDWGSVVVEEPVTKPYTPKRGSTFESVTSEVYFPGPNGEKRPIFVELAPQNFWGVSPTYPYGMRKENQNYDTIDGFHIAYPLTSISTVDNPTEDERITKCNLDEMWEITCEAMQRFCSVKKEKRKVPPPTYSAFGTAKADEDWSYAVKPLYEHPKTTDKFGQKVPDLSKPMKMYIKLITSGKGRNLRCFTKIYGPGDKQVSPFKYNSIRGDGHPIVLWDGIYWGSHGRTSYGASLRLRLTEMNFTPSQDPSRLSSRRMLPPNKAVSEEEEEVTTEEEEDFLEIPLD